MKYLPSKGLIAAVAVTAIALVSLAPSVDARPRYRDGYHDYAHHRHWYHGGWVMDGPGYYPPPAPVVYAPPPPSPGISLVLPLNFR